MALQMQQLGALSLSPPKANVPIRTRDDKPAYLVGGKGFFDQNDKYWYPNQALEFDGEPNLDFIPLNKVAYDKMVAFWDKLDALGLRTAKKNGKEYINIVRQAWTDEGVADEIPTPDSVLGAKRYGENKALR